jgi:UDP-glucose 4-epimerase
MRVLVTGGAGFIGSHLVEALVARGAQIRVLDDFSTGKHENLAKVEDQIQILEGDIRDPNCCARAVAGVDCVFHLAAVTSVVASLADPTGTIEVNLLGSAKLFRAARDAKVKRIVYASSAGVYGADAAVPNHEGDEGKPLSPYAASKAMTEQLAAAYASCYSMSLVGLRYFNVYGPRQAPNSVYAAVVPQFLAACKAGQPLTIHGDGAQSRDFVYVSDVVAANLAALDMSPSTANANATANANSAATYNVGTGVAVSVRQLAEHLKQLTRSPGVLTFIDGRPNEIPCSRADTTLAERELGFVARTSLREGLLRMLEG